MRKFRRYKIVDRSRFTISIIVAFLLGLFVGLYIDVLKYPECYLTTWKYQLKQDIISGNEKEIEYYENTYVKNDRLLFELGGF